MTAFEGFWVAISRWWLHRRAAWPGSSSPAAPEYLPQCGIGVKAAQFQGFFDDGGKVLVCTDVLHTGVGRFRWHLIEEKILDLKDRLL